MSGDNDFPGPGAQTWRPPSGILIGLMVVALAAAAAAVLDTDPMDRLVYGLVGVVLLVLALVGRRRRLVAGPRGLLIAGAGGARIVPWSMVRSIECGRTRRMRTATLEIDLVDGELLLYGRLDLGAEPDAVLADLTGWFEGRDDLSGPARS